MTVTVCDALFYLQTATPDQPFGYFFQVAAQAKGDLGDSNQIMIQLLRFSCSINMVLDQKDDDHLVEYTACQDHLLWSIWIKMEDKMGLCKFYKNVLLSFASILHRRSECE